MLAVKKRQPKPYLQVIQLIEGFTLIGKAEDHPEIVAVMEAAENKAKLVQAAYDLMNKEVLDQMFIVFGTTKPESATANQQTWQLMKDKPQLFVPSKFSTEAEVLTFADAKILAVESYAVWR